jgi:hypothetical protein
MWSRRRASESYADGIDGDTKRDGQKETDSEMRGHTHIHTHIHTHTHTHTHTHARTHAHTHTHITLRVLHQGVHGQRASRRHQTQTSQRHTIQPHEHLTLRSALPPTNQSLTPTPATPPHHLRVRLSDNIPEPSMLATEPSTACVRRHIPPCPSASPVRQHYCRTRSCRKVERQRERYYIAAVRVACTPCTLVCGSEECYG